MGDAVYNLKLYYVRFARQASDESRYYDAGQNRLRALSEFVAANTGEHGSYENVSESHAFAAPEASYEPLTAAEIIARNPLSEALILPLLGEAVT